MFFISITGLNPKGIIGFLRFWSFAIPYLKQAHKTKEIKFCQVIRIKSCQCTLTTQESREDILNLIRSRVHLKAMQAFHKIAKGRTYGFEPNTIPTWTAANYKLQEKAIEY